MCTDIFGKENLDDIDYSNYKKILMMVTAMYWMTVTCSMIKILIPNWIMKISSTMNMGLAMTKYKRITL